MPTVTKVNVSDLHFSAPVKVKAKEFTCHYQYASYKHETLYMETPYFESNGPYKSQFNDKLHLLMHDSSIDLFRDIDEKAKKCLSLPDDAPKQWKKCFENKQAYRCLPSEKLYIKLAPDLKIFNAKGEVTTEPLGRGRYKAVIQIIGIYIGHHGFLPQFASLQMKVKQLKYLPCTESLFLEEGNPSFGDVSPQNAVSDELSSETVSTTSRLKRHGQALPKLNIVAPILMGADDKEEEEETEMHVPIEKCEDVDHLLTLYRMNDYPTQQQTEEEQERHDKFLMSIATRLDELRGKNNWF